MDNRIIPLLLIIIVASVTTAFAQDPADLTVLIDTALERNPDLQAAEARWTMYANKIVPAQSLSDPRLSLGLSSYPVNSLASDESPMTGNDVRLDQALPFPGKLSLKGEIAAQQATWYRAMFLDRRLELARQVRDAWYRLAYLDQALRLVTNNLAVIDQLTQLSETRFSVGKGLQQDVLRAQLQHSKLMDQQLALEQKRLAVLEELRALLDQPDGDITPGGMSESLDIPDLTAALAKFESSRPLFNAYRAMIDQYHAEQKLAKRDYWPDFNLWAGYRFRDDNLPDGGEDFVSAGMSFNLPINLKKRQAVVAQAESGQTMAQQQYRDVYNRNVAALEDVFSQIKKDRDLVLLYRTGIIPQATQSYEAGLSSYQVGKISFLELVDSLSSLYNYQTEYQRALSDFHRAQARFLQLSGADDESLSSDSRHRN